MKSNENVVEVKATVSTDCHLDINRMAKEMNTYKEMMRQILMMHLNMKKCSCKIK